MRKPEAQSIEPFANSRFAGVDLLAAADEANDYRPVLMSIEIGDQEFRFRRAEVGDFFPALHEVSCFNAIPCTLCFVEDHDMVVGWVRSPYTFIPEMVHVLNESLDWQSNDAFSHPPFCPRQFIAD